MCRLRFFVHAENLILSYIPDSSRAPHVSRHLTNCNDVSPVCCLVTADGSSPLLVNATKTHLVKLRYCASSAPGFRSPRGSITATISCLPFRLTNASANDHFTSRGGCCGSKSAEAPVEQQQGVGLVSVLLSATGYVNVYWRSFI
jgi:hypothetical protein